MLPACSMAKFLVGHDFKGHGRVVWGSDWRKTATSANACGMHPGPRRSGDQGSWARAADRRRAAIPSSTKGHLAEECPGRSRPSLVARLFSDHEELRLMFPSRASTSPAGTPTRLPPFFFWA